MNVTVTHNQMDILIQALASRVYKIDDMIVFWEEKSQAETAQFYREEREECIALREQLIAEKYKGLETNPL